MPDISPAEARSRAVALAARFESLAAEIGDADNAERRYYLREAANIWLTLAAAPGASTPPLAVADAPTTASTHRIIWDGDGHGTAAA